MCYLQIVIYLFIYLLFNYYTLSYVPKNNRKYKLTHSPLNRAPETARADTACDISVLMVKDNFVR